MINLNSIKSSAVKLFAFLLLMATLSSCKTSIFMSDYGNHTDHNKRKTTKWMNKKVRLSHTNSK